MLFPVPGASAQLARMVEDLGFDSLVFADTQNITPELGPADAGSARHRAHRARHRRDEPGHARCGGHRVRRSRAPGREQRTRSAESVAATRRSPRSAGRPSPWTSSRRTSFARAIDTARKAAAKSGRDPDALRLGAWINSVVHPDLAAARDAVRGGLSVFAHFSGFAGMKMETMDPSLREAALHLRSNYDVRDHGRADTAHARGLDADFVDSFGIVGPVETAVPRFERLAALGLDFCRVVPGSRDAPREIVAASMLTLATTVRQAVA